MAERRGHDRSVQFAHAFDRLLAVRLEQVYAILVPEWVRAIGVDQSVRGKHDEGCRDLRQVSSEQQKEENTIASQTAALIDFAREQGYSVPDDWVIEDEGFSGAHRPSGGALCPTYYIMVVGCCGKRLACYGNFSCGFHRTG
jgi:site-specific DNA recombinase